VLVTHVVIVVAGCDFREMFAMIHWTSSERHVQQTGAGNGSNLWIPGKRGAGRMDIHNLYV